MCHETECPDCDGVGWTDVRMIGARGYRCDRCDGIGEIPAEGCPACEGTGHDDDGEPCPVCNGAGRIPELPTEEH